MKKKSWKEKKIVWRKSWRKAHNKASALHNVHKRRNDEIAVHKNNYVSL